MTITTVYTNDLTDPSRSKRLVARNSEPRAKGGVDPRHRLTDADGHCGASRLARRGAANGRWRGRARW